MPNATTFDAVLDAIEHLPEGQQADLVDLVRRRLAERSRRRIIADAREARAEHAAGKTRPLTLRHTFIDNDANSL